MSVRRWKEALGKEGLGNQITRVGGEEGVQCFTPFSTLPAPPSLWLKRVGVGRRGPTFTHAHKNRNNGERDQSRDRI